VKASERVLSQFEQAERIEENRHDTQEKPQLDEQFRLS